MKQKLHAELTSMFCTYYTKPFLSYYSVTSLRKIYGCHRQYQQKARYLDLSNNSQKTNESK